MREECVNCWLIRVSLRRTNASQRTSNCSGVYSSYGRSAVETCYSEVSDSGLCRLRLKELTTIFGWANDYREDPKAPQYQLRLYCTSGDFYHPHNTPYGSAARQSIPVEFPLSSEAKMNDVPVIANLRGIKKKPGTAPPAHVSSAKIGNPSRTNTNSTPPSTNTPVGSYALKLGHTRENNKVELVYMNTEKVYYMIVYFVEAFSVQQVVEKIKKERFRQKEDVLKSSKCQIPSSHLDFVGEVRVHENGS